jgi:hypothetical protein
MKKLVITVGLLLCACSTQKDIIYSSKKVHKSISNLETMRKWILHDVKDGTNVDHYHMLIDQTIYNLERNIIPKKPHNHSSSFNYLNLLVYRLELRLDHTLHSGDIGEVYYEDMMKKLIEIKSTIKKIENGW